MIIFKRTSLLILIGITVILIGFQLFLIFSPIKKTDRDSQFVDLASEYQVLKMQRLVLEEKYALARTKQKVLTLASNLQKNNAKAFPATPIVNPKIQQHIGLSYQENKTFEQLEAYVSNNKPIQPDPLTSDEQNILSSPSEDFTLQLMGVRDKDELSRFIQSNKIQEAQVFHTYYLNKDWYVLVSGRYKNHTEALKAIESLPDNIKELKPWIRQLTTIQKAIALYR